MLDPLGLWLDHRSSKPYGFISHAHADHFAHHERILCSPGTAAIIKKRYGVAKSKIQSVNYNQPFEYSHTAEAIQFKQADHLIMETTFGKPHYVMPPSHTVVKQLVDFVDSAIDDQVTPVILAYSLGKAQEAHYLLGQNSIAPVLHPAVAKISAECIRMRVNLPDYFYLDELCPARQCIIMPPGALKSTYLSSVAKYRTAMLTG